MKCLESWLPLGAPQRPRAWCLNKNREKPRAGPRSWGGDAPADGRTEKRKGSDGGKRRRPDAYVCLLSLTDRFKWHYLWWRFWDQVVHRFILSPPHSRERRRFSRCLLSDNLRNQSDTSALLMLRNNIKGANWQKSQEGWSWARFFLQLLPVHI